MPQLDSLSWFDQVFSATLVFFTFYLLLAVFFLPALVSIFKGRQKLQNFRQYIAEIYTVQLNLLTLNTNQTLSVLIFNNLFLINFYHQPLFLQELQANLVKTCYAASEMVGVEGELTSVAAYLADDQEDFDYDCEGISWWSVDAMPLGAMEEGLITELSFEVLEDAEESGFPLTDLMLSAVGEDQTLVSFMPLATLDESVLLTLDSVDDFD